MSRATSSIVLAVLVTATVVHADPKEEAKAHVVKAQAAMAADRFEEALAELKAAYKLDPDFNLLFAMGQVYVQLGRCTEASTHYDRFLERTKDGRARSVVAQAMAACREKERAEASPPEPPPPPPPPPEVPPPPPPKSAEPAKGAPARPTSEPAKAVPPKPTGESAKAASPPRAKTEPRGRSAGRVASAGSDDGRAKPLPPEVRDDAPGPWYTDKIGAALVITGAACGLVGGVLYANARADVFDAGRARTYPEYEAALDDARGKRNTSLLLFVAAAGLVTGGVIRYASVDRDEPARTFGVAPAGRGGVVTWSGRF